MATTETKPFRMRDYIKDGHLAKVLRNELAGLTGDELTKAQEAIVDVATMGEQGTYEQLVDQYRQAIQRALHPERKIVKNATIDRKIVRNPQLAAHLEKELVDVTAEEVAAVNAALKTIFDEARRISIEGTQGTIRHVTHEPSAICRNEEQHPTVPEGDKKPCGYFRAPDEWREVLRQEVRKVLKR